MAADHDPELRAYADEIGLYFERYGLPRMSGRILGWLLVCDPPYQSADEIADALGASRGSISMALRLPQANSVIVRHPMPGSRRIYYRLRPGFWLQEADEKARVAHNWRKLVERGLGVMADLPPERRQRLQEARDMYAFLEEEYAQIATRWKERQENREK